MSAYTVSYLVIPYKEQVDIIPRAKIESSMYRHIKQAEKHCDKRDIKYKLCIKYLTFYSHVIGIFKKYDTY